MKNGKVRFPPCGLCRIEPASCQSHIIPRRFFLRAKGKGPHLHVIESEFGNQLMDRKFSQNGIWEQGILCPKCDEGLGVFDEYAYEVLPETPSHAQTEYVNPKITRYNLGAVDCGRFKSFLIALLWRASRATHPLFDQIHLRSHEKRFAEILRGKRPISQEPLDCGFVHLDTVHYKGMIFPPMRGKYDGIDVLQFYLYPWKLLINLQRHPFDAEQRQFALNSVGCTYAIREQDFTATEKRMIRDLQPKVKAYEAAREARRQGA